MWKLIAIALSIAVVYASLARLNELPIEVDLSDKWLHLICYFSLTLVYIIAWPSLLVRAWPLFIGMALLGISIEILQKLSGYRWFEWLDIVANLSGICLAFVVAYLFKYLRSSKGALK